MRFLIKIMKSLGLFILFSWANVSSVLGYIVNGGGGGVGSSRDSIGSGSVGVSSTDWFENVFVWIIGLAGVVAAAVLIFSAYLYITASGDEQKIQKATKGITYAIVGLIVAAIAFLIVNFVISGI